MSTLRIGELAKLTGIKVETVRYYERQNLLSPPPRSTNGYRLYSKQDADKVLFILKAKQVGFSLKEIAELLSIRVDTSSHTCGEVKQLAESKLSSIEEKIAQLTQMHNALSLITEACCGGQEAANHCTILQALDACTISAERL